MTTDQPTATCPTCGSAVTIQGDTTLHYQPVETAVGPTYTVVGGYRADGEQDRYANTATRRADRLEAENAKLLAELQAARRVVNIARELETVLLATDTRPSQADLAAYSAQMRPALVAHDTRLDALRPPAAEPTLRTMDDVQRDVWEWIEATFEPRNRPMSFALKAREEIAELIESSDPVEAADVVITMMGYCGAIGLSLQELITMKMARNRTRTWTQDEHGVGSHVPAVREKGPVIDE